MSLIECEECGSQISNKAKVCPKCGIPLEYDETFLEDDAERIAIKLLTATHRRFSLQECSNCGYSGEMIFHDGGEISFGTILMFVAFFAPALIVGSVLRLFGFDTHNLEDNWIGIVFIVVIGLVGSGLAMYTKDFLDRRFHKNEYECPSCGNKSNY